MWLELRGARLRFGKAIASSGEVNWLTGPCGECAPAFNPSHADLARSEECPEQHGGGVGRWQHGLRFNPAPEFLMQSFDDVGSAQSTPLTLREAREGEQARTGFLQASATGRCLIRHLRTKALRRVSTSAAVLA